MELTDRKAEPVQQVTSPAGQNDGRTGEHGFTLLEIVCVVAILTMILALIPPMFSRGTSKTKLEGYAVAAAALLKADRNAAMRRHASVATAVDAKSRMLRSGASGRILRIPDDVTFDALLAAICNKSVEGSTIRFFPSGMSCGGVIALSQPGFGYQIRVNWLTGGIEIAALNNT
jgi:general secretion pathway protein H